MGKLSSILLGTVSGAAAALFLNSAKGKEWTNKALDFLYDVQEHPEEVRENLVQSANEFSQQATTAFENIKEKVETGQITPETVVESVKDKTQEVVTFSQDKFSEIKEKISQENLTTTDLLAQVKGKVADLTEKTESQEIVLDLPEEVVTSEEEKTEES